MRVATQTGQQSTGRLRKESLAASPRDIITCSPFEKRAATGPILTSTPCREISQTPPPPPPKSIPSIFRSGGSVCTQEEEGGIWGGIQTPAGLICLVSHSPQLSFPQHLDTVKHLADADKIQQAFAAGFGRNPQRIQARFKAVHSELGLVKNGNASCNQRLPLTSI